MCLALWGGCQSVRSTPWRRGAGGGVSCRREFEKTRKDTVCAERRSISTLAGKKKEEKDKKSGLCSGADCRMDNLPDLPTKAASQ